MNMNTMNPRSFVIALLLSVLSFASTVRADGFNASNPFAVENAFDLNYDVINPWSENRLPGEFVRNYNRELGKLYDNLDKSGPFKYCATGGFGCNYMSQSSFKGALKGHEARAQESIASYRNRLESRLVDYSTDITNIQNGRDIEGPLTKALLRGRKVSPNSQLQSQKGEIIDENRHLNSVLTNRQDLSSDAQAILDSGVLKPEIPDPNAIEEADNSIDDPTRAIDRWGYSSDFDANFDQLMNKAQFLANNGRPGEANIVASMAGRYKDFHRGQTPAAVAVSPAAASQFPYLKSLDQSSFQGHEAVSIGNAISGLDNVVDGANFYIDLAMDRLSYLQEQPVIGQYLATAEFIWTFHYRLANNPDFALSIGEGVGGVVIDAATGFAQFLAHPIDSSIAVYNAVVEYEKTWHAMKGFAVKAYDDLSTCDQETEECGQIIGRIGGEVAFGTLTAGVGTAIKNTAIAVKVTNKINSTVGKVAGKFARRGKALDLDADDLDTVFQTGYSLTPCEMPLACAPDSVANADTLLKLADDMGLKGADAVDGVKKFGGSARKSGIKHSDELTEFATPLKLRPNSTRVPKSKYDWNDIVNNAKWERNELNKHAWDRHPGLAKDGPNQLPNTRLYDQGARQVIRDADIVVERTKGDILFIDSKKGLGTSVQKKPDGSWKLNSYRIQTLDP
ncbi:hypothetical protein [Pseudobacteriovorax antillogorgiicola]|uniref:Uncharacterized protein n=1 Tax=Pseudobacteriovorax antillogorgiicola TaxID=1513793 RepID=A0A1Y6BXF5_9BACT|nr:hypothetical protein [Pseudobacteriovorax antillogorgiicola]TCS53065.1 hypothetical protein EDD56_108116 [Pseudobacteriovorax antillogorgiicola]SMF26304.1 hypothetical protein SAMN06296036_108131 [Pseudobacteriovorax antillogorgiicola]